jgi:hypothetical protein
VDETHERVQVFHLELGHWLDVVGRNVSERVGIVVRTRSIKISREKEENVVRFLHVDWDKQLAGIMLEKAGEYCKNSWAPTNLAIVGESRARTCGTTLSLHCWQVLLLL